MLLHKPRTKPPRSTGNKQKKKIIETSLKLEFATYVLAKPGEG